MNWRSILAGGVALALVFASYGVAPGLASPPGDGPGLASPAPDDARGLQAGATTYAVRQGDRCFEVSPFGDGLRRVEDFYAYRNPETERSDDSYTSYSSYGTVELQENQVSAVFVYRGSEGTSLVFLHDEHGGDSQANAPHGGAVTFELRGLPSDGSWVVRDDYYDGGSQNDRWTAYGEPARSYTVDWVWRDGRTDGGAYRGLGRLGDDEAVRIAPAFDERAALWSDSLNGTTDRIRAWRLLDGDGGHVDLDTTQPVAVRPGPCRNVTIERRGTNRVRLSASGDERTEILARYVPPAPATEPNETRLSRIALRPRDPTPPFAVDVSTLAERPRGLPPVEGPTDVLAYVLVEPAGTADGRVASGTFQLDVARQRYESRNLHPDGVVLYQYRNGSWTALETPLAYRTADAYVFEATAPGSSPLALGVVEPQLSVVEVSPSAREVVRGDRVVVTARIENGGPGSGTTEVAFTVGGTVVERRTVELAAGDTRQLRFATRINQTGTWELGVGGRTVEVEVHEPRVQLEVVDLTTDRSTIEAGEEVVVTATVTNVGRVGGTGTVSFTAFGEETATERVELAPNETDVVTFAQSIEAPGTYRLGVNGETVEVTVTGTDQPQPTPTPATPAPAGGSTLVLVGILVLAGIVGLILLWR